MPRPRSLYPYHGPDISILPNHRTFLICLDRTRVRRSRMRDFSGPSSVRGARIRGRFGLSRECRPKEAVGSGSGTGYRDVVLL